MCDGIIGEKTLSMLLSFETGSTGAINYDYITTGAIGVSANMKAFSCNHCGGTSYSYKNGHAVCDYCGSYLIREGVA